MSIGIMIILKILLAAGFIALGVIFFCVFFDQAILTRRGTIYRVQTNAKKIVNLEEKLKAQREIKDSEKKRNEMRKRLYEMQDEVDSKKEKLLETIEAQLKQKSKLEPLFTIHWRIV